MSSTWHAALHRLQQNGTPHVLATQITSAGSTPREPGARMVVTAHDAFDTLGGGTFEWQTIQVARDLLQQGIAGLHVESFSLGGRSGQCCGGFVNVLLETFLGISSTIALFGAGHVGREIVKLSAPLPWHIEWYDSRPDIFNVQDIKQPRLSCHSLSNLQESVSNLPPHSHALVLTHDHGEDYALIAALIQHPNISSIGLIGSDSKWSSFQNRLKRDGHTPEAIQQVRCPIGTVHDAKLSNKTPYAIAMTVVTELLWLTDQPTSEPIRGVEPEALRTLFNDIATHQN